MMKTFRTYGLSPRPVLIEVHGNRVPAILLRIINGAIEKRDVDGDEDMETVMLKKQLKELSDYGQLRQDDYELVLIDFDGFRDTRPSTAAICTLYDHLRMRMGAVAVMADSSAEFVVIEGNFRARNFGKIIKRSEIRD